jgi:colicin import membrane protein
MKQFLIVLMMLMPMLATAQDNTWERIEVEEQPKDNPDAKYLAPNAVPEVDGKVVFQTTLYAEGKTADEIYDILLEQMKKMTNEPNQLGNSLVALQDRENHEIGAVYHEWLVFKNVTFSLDRTHFNFQLHVVTRDGEADVSMQRITDKYAVNKKHTKLYPVSAKFRRKTIDRKDFIFNKFNTLINNK